MTGTPEYLQTQVKGDDRSCIWAVMEGGYDLFNASLSGYYHLSGERERLEIMPVPESVAVKTKYWGKYQAEEELPDVFSLGSVVED
tara:strand:- start:157 stop:414 length:258 start_codon:yes stop_codon:yes gene_type:complete